MQALELRYFVNSSLQHSFKLVKEIIKLHNKGELKGKKQVKKIGTKIKDLSTILFTPLQGKHNLY